MCRWLKRRLKGWRTMAFAMLVTAFGLLDALSVVDLTPLLSAWLPEGRVGAVLSLIGIATAWLRYVTTTAMGEKDDAPEPDLSEGEPHR